MVLVLATLWKILASHVKRLLYRQAELTWPIIRLVFSTSSDARVAQWLERRALRFDYPCVGGLNPTVGRGCRSSGRDRINRGPVSQ
jgi:hypothetical protein